MSQFDFIKDIAKYGLENNQEQLLKSLSEFIAYSRETKKVNFALQLQSILKDALHQQQTKGLSKVGSKKYFLQEDNRLIDELIIEKITSDYKFENIICPPETKEDLEFLVNEHKSIDVLNSFDLSISNKILFHGPSGCGKTLASYVLAGELEKMMYVINLGAIVSSKLGETSKNLTKIFRHASSEDCIIFLDEFDSLGKLRDYNQDHGEMKRVVNTLLQLFDYLPQNSIVIAATNQLKIIDDALIRRFDLKVNLDLPDKKQIEELINKTIEKTPFKFESDNIVEELIETSHGLSFYIIQKSITTSIKKTLFTKHKEGKEDYLIDTEILRKIFSKEKELNLV